MILQDGNVFYDGKFIKKDICIQDSKITDGKAGKIIDAKGKYIVPGLIDIHVHFRDFGQEEKEDWISGSKAAISSGITTVLDMPNNKTPITSIKLLNDKKDQVSKKSLVNYGLYIAVTNENIDEINNSDVGFVKLYYGVSTGDIKVVHAEEIFKKLRKDILIVAHAEDNEIIDLNQRLYDKDNIKYHSLVRDNKAEYNAVNDLINLVEKYDKKIHFTHISTKESILLIKRAKSKGLKATCDTCPHYLFLDDTHYDKLGNLLKVNPAVKSRKDKEYLWKFINEGVIDCICSDHGPHLLREKFLDYENNPSGLPGVETTLSLMLTAVNEGKIKLEKFIQMMTENPAEIFGIENKGFIKKGYEADLVIIDLEKGSVIKGSNLYSKAGWTPYEGFKTKGKAVMTFENGYIVYDGKFHEKLGKEIKLKHN